DPVPVDLAEFGHGCAADDAGIIEQDMNGAEFALHTAAYSVSIGGAGDIGRFEDGLAAGASDFVCDRSTVGVDVGDSDGCAVLREQKRGCASDAGSAAGDESDFVGQIQLVIVLQLRGLRQVVGWERGSPGISF